MTLTYQQQFVLDGLAGRAAILNLDARHNRLYSAGDLAGWVTTFRHSGASVRRGDQTFTDLSAAFDGGNGRRLIVRASTRAASARLPQGGRMRSPFRIGCLPIVRLPARTHWQKWGLWRRGRTGARRRERAFGAHRRIRFRRASACADVSGDVHRGRIHHRRSRLCDEPLFDAPLRISRRNRSRELVGARRRLDAGRGEIV